MKPPIAPQLLRIITLILVGATWTLGCASPAPVVEPPPATVVASIEGTGYAGFRQVGVVRTPDGSLLVYFQGRYVIEDTAPKDHLLTRSVDQGRTWTRLVVIAKRADIEPLGEMFRWGNPCAVVDYRRGKIILFSGSSFGISPLAYHRSSIDNGVSWSEPTELNLDELFAHIDRPDHQPMPGHGIQLRSGRLVVPVLHKNGGFGVEKDFLIGVIYSDDGGGSWKAGGVAQPSGKGNEWSVAETSIGELYMNSRNAEGLYRVEAVSTDGGVSWSRLEEDRSLPENKIAGGTACGVLATTHPVGGMVLTTPDPLEERRVHLTAYYSTDDGGTWQRGPRLHEGYSSYSDLVELADQRTIGVAFQGGPSPESAILFRTFDWAFLQGTVE